MISIFYILLYLLITLFFSFIANDDINGAQCDFTKWQEFKHNIGIFMFGLFWPIWILLLIYLILKEFLTKKQNNYD